MLEGTTILDAGKIPNAQLRDLLGNIHDFDILAMEGMQSYGLPVGREVLDTCVWIGRFIEQCPKNVKLWPVFRPAIRAYFCGVARKGASTGDAGIRKAMLLRYGKFDTRNITSDMWSALAISTFVADKIRAGQHPPKNPVSMLAC